MPEVEGDSLLKIAREKTDISLTDLARLSGMNLSTLSKIENNHRPIHADEVKPLARILGCGPEELLPDDEGAAATEHQQAAQERDWCRDEHAGPLVLTKRGQAALYVLIEEVHGTRKQKKG